MSVAGFDGGGATDSDDAGPFRWFIDERSLSAPGNVLARRNLVFSSSFQQPFRVVI